MGLIRSGKWAIVWGQATNIKNRYTKKGKEFTTFSVAYDKDENDKSIYMNCNAWQKLSSDYVCRFEKGDNVVIFGTMIKDDYWSERNGKDEWKMNAEIAVAQTYFEDAMDGNSSEGTFDNPADVDDDDILNSVF